MAEAWDAIVSDPRGTDKRQYQLKGELGTTYVQGVALDQWQYKVTGGGRIWYAIDDAQQTLLVKSETGPRHPKATA
jgi:hypothetical protein